MLDFSFRNEKLFPWEDNTAPKVTQLKAFAVVKNKGEK